jgi:hypothetical protein
MVATRNKRCRKYHPEESVTFKYVTYGLSVSALIFFFDMLTDVSFSVNWFSTSSLVWELFSYSPFNNRTCNLAWTRDVCSCRNVEWAVFWRLLTCCLRENRTVFQVDGFILLHNNWPALTETVHLDLLLAYYLAFFTCDKKSRSRWRWLLSMCTTREESVNRSQMRIKRKACDIRTWKKYLFL